MAGTGANELVAGFSIGGGDAAATEPVLIRASGPALSQFGITGFLADPELQLFSTASGSVLLASNGGWAGNAAVSSDAAAEGAFVWTDPTSLDAALVQTLPSGPYTANITGSSGDTGIALVEVYDATPASSLGSSAPQLENVSARAEVGAGGSQLVAGFVIGGSTSKTVLIRASGPALGQFGVTGTLPDPELQLYNLDSAGNSLVASNDAWGGDPEIIAAATSVGAFAWTDPSSPDCALLITLPPGAYSANVLGVNGSSGVALVEVYELP
jgi:hypothetical protein